MMNWDDIYKLPLQDTIPEEPIGRVCDQGGNFVFQFCHFGANNNIALDAINGKSKLTSKHQFYSDDEGYICRKEDDLRMILIRGWGNLTGIGGHNLSGEDAANIQDTMAKYIVEQLNKR